MKSLINLDKLRTKYRSKLAEGYRYSTIIYLPLVDQNMRAMFGEAWGCWDQERHGTWWRLYKLLKARFDALLIAQWTWSSARVQAGLHVMMERSRQRQTYRKSLIPPDFVVGGMPAEQPWGWFP